MISKKTKHAVDVCVCLAEQSASYVSINELSPRLGLSVSYLENILRPLKAHHVVSAMKGPGGGYMLSGDPANLTVWDIVCVFERTLMAAPDDALDLDPAEDISPPEAFELGLEQVVKATLSRSRLADLVETAHRPEARAWTQNTGRFKFKPMAPPLVPKAPNSVFQLSAMMA